MLQNIELFQIIPCKVGDSEAVRLSGFLGDFAISAFRSIFLNHCLEPERDFILDLGGLLKISPLMLSYFEDIAFKLYRLHGKLIITNIPDSLRGKLISIARSHENVLIVIEAEETKFCCGITELKCF